jgi:CBS domain-containing protein
MMRCYDCGIVPVVDERDAILGVVTDRDVCLALGTGEMAPADTPVHRIMKQPVVCCSADDDCVGALLAMEEHGIRRLPVVGTDGAVVGVISLDDIVRWASRAPTTDPLRTMVFGVLAGVEAGGATLPAGPERRTS